MIRCCLLLAGILTAVVRADEGQALETPANRVAPGDPAWAELAAGMRRQDCVTADFTEERRFSFKRAPTVLRGEVRVSAKHGLSLRYLGPNEQIVIIDERGVLLRSPEGDSIPLADPRAGAANSALLDVLRLDLGRLGRTFDLYGLRTGAAWKLALVPRAADLRRSLGRIVVEGAGGAVRRIELRRSATQRVEISVEPPRTTGAFTAGELLRYFR